MAELGPLRGVQTRQAELIAAHLGTEPPGSSHPALVECLPHPLLLPTAFRAQTRSHPVHAHPTSPQVGKGFPLLPQLLGQVLALSFHTAGNRESFRACFPQPRALPVGRTGSAISLPLFQHQHRMGAWPMVGQFLKYTAGPRQKLIHIYLLSQHRGDGS